MENLEPTKEFKEESVSLKEKEELRREIERVKNSAEKNDRERKGTSNIELVGINLDELTDKDWQLYAKFKGWEQVRHRDADEEFKELERFRRGELYPHIEESINKLFEEQKKEIGDETAKPETRLSSDAEGRPGSGSVIARDSRQNFFEWITHQWVSQTADLKLAKKRRRGE